jgi:hypothetical protein
MEYISTPKNDQVVFPRPLENSSHGLHLFVLGTEREWRLLSVHTNTH